MPSSKVDLDDTSLRTAMGRMCEKAP